MNIDMPISLIMTTDIVSVQPEEKLVVVKHIFEKENFHHHIPVVENGKPVGMISLMDFLFFIKGASLMDTEKVYTKFSVKDVMSTKLVTMPPKASVREAGEVFLKNLIHSIVIEKDGKLIGIITTTDLIKLMMKQKSVEKIAA